MMASHFLRLTFFTLLVYSALLDGQLLQNKTADWSHGSKRAAEDMVARTIDEIRTSANRPALKRVSPSIMDVQLVCTAAVSGRKVGDSIFAGLITYVTNDPSAQTEALRKITLDSPKKEFPRYSVIVEGNRNTKLDNPAYTVEVA